MKIKLSQWAEKHKIPYLTAYRRFKSGKIPNSEQLESGTILISEEEVNDNNNIDLIKKSILLKLDEIKNILNKE